MSNYQSRKVMYQVIIENVLKPLCLQAGCSANCPQISFVKKVALRNCKTLSFLVKPPL